MIRSPKQRLFISGLWNWKRETTVYQSHQKGRSSWTKMPGERFFQDRQNPERV